MPTQSSVAADKRPVVYSRSLRASASAILAILASLMLIPARGALADTKVFFPDKQAWFWVSNEKVSTCTEYDVGPPDQPPVVDSACQPVTATGGGLAPNTSPITPGHLPVAVKDGEPDMRSFIHFDTSFIPPGSEILSYEVVLNVSLPTTEHANEHRQFGDDDKTFDQNGRPPATANQDNAEILACPVTEPWGPQSPGGEGEPPYSTTVNRGNPETEDTADDETTVTTTKNQPGFDMGGCGTGVRSKDGTTWTFDLTLLAKRWAKLELFDEGIALIPTESGLHQSWTVEFHGGETVLQEGDNKVTVVRKASAARAKVDFIPAPPLAPPSLDPGPLPGPGGDQGTFPSFNTPPAPEPVEPPPASAPSAPPAIGPNVPVAGKAQTPAWLLGLFPIGILGLGLVSGAIGNDGVLAAGGANRVASVLRSRRMAGAGMLSETATIAREEEAAAREDGSGTG